MTSFADHESTAELERVFPCEREMALRLRAVDWPRSETGAASPGGFGSVHAIRLGIEPFAELGANSASLSGSEVDSSCSRRTFLGLAPVTVLQSLCMREYGGPAMSIDFECVSCG